MGMHTAPSSERLAEELEKVGLTKMAAKARQNYYHDFFSELAAPAMTLAKDLLYAAEMAKADPVLYKAILKVRERHVMDGDFDATKAESDEWAESPEGRETFGTLADAILKQYQ